MTIAGETYVIVRPEVAGFAPALESQVVAQSRKAGVAAGAAAGEGFGRSFRQTLKTGALLLGITGAFEAVRKSVEATGEHQAAIALLQRGVENVGAAYKVQGQDLEDLIRKQALATGFIDEDLYPAFTRLVTATDDTRKSLKDLGLAEDIARQRHIGVTVAALALAKAEQGSVTSLQRLGVILPGYAKNLDRAQRAALALTLVQERFGGSAAAFATTGAGQFARLGEAVHVLEEAVGGAILPSIEAVATATANWTSNSANLERVERTVADVGHIVANSAHAAAAALKIAHDVTQPLASVLGGYVKVAELAFGYVALRKILAVTTATARWAAVTVAGDEAVVVSTTEVAGAATAATVAIEAETTASVAAAGGLARLGISATGLASVFGRAGVAGAVGIAGYELSTFIRKIPGWETAFEGLGKAIAGSTAGIRNVPSSGFRDVEKLAETARKVQQEFNSPANRTPRGFLQTRDQLVQAILGPGYTFNDLQSAVRVVQRRANAGQTQGPEPAGARTRVTATVAQRATDLDYQLSVQQALSTKQTADEEALYQARVRYLDRRIKTLQADTNLSAAAKKNLLRLEQERADIEGQITQIDKKRTDDAAAAAQKAKAAAEKTRQAYVASVGAQEQILELNAARATLTENTVADDRKAAVASLAFDRRNAQDTKLTVDQRRQYAAKAIQEQETLINIGKTELASHLSLEEQRLQLQVQRAQLTTKSLTDDRKATLKLIAFYQREAHDARLTTAQRLQYQAQALQALIGLQQLKPPGGGGAGGGATVAQIFGEAASEFRTYASNIASRSGVLSGQDARAQFSSLILRHAGSMSELARSVSSIANDALLSESKTQTDLLRRIANAADGGRHGRKPPSVAIKQARGTADIVGG